MNEDRINLCDLDEASTIMLVESDDEDYEEIGSSKDIEEEEEDLDDDIEECREEYDNFTDLDDRTAEDLKLTSEYLMHEEVEDDILDIVFGDEVENAEDIEDMPNTIEDDDAYFNDPDTVGNVIDDDIDEDYDESEDDEIMDDFFDEAMEFEDAVLEADDDFDDDDDVDEGCCKEEDDDIDDDDDGDIEEAFEDAEDYF